MKKVITYDELLAKIPNKYILTIAAGKRARDIGKGAPLLVKCGKKDTAVKKTFKEIVEDKLTFGYQEENE
ncbi:MAG: DNA-directed RNA polymerase subunit omega [Cetobacterium sp.]|uniref:DNA-directed RNA polymerase subunit omega n=1 Tax=Cetobacterium ceti TaxID=180163 RepID=A0A1T4QA48_9FUSO|nr:DNA-directed RNA polymerase subunit omega [Cetobacterium ceti]MCJ8341580.1 DNA-directed RNA polymerase subunit omega [Cetobacterium sp.]SKA00517.1 DNA-directed RNA polymerase subunit omega [Cetobacterium ceti]